MEKESLIGELEALEKNIENTEKQIENQLISLRFSLIELLKKVHAHYHKGEENHGRWWILKTIPIGPHYKLEFALTDKGITCFNTLDANVSTVTFEAFASSLSTLEEMKNVINNLKESIEMVKKIKILF